MFADFIGTTICKKKKAKRTMMWYNDNDKKAKGSVI